MNEQGYLIEKAPIHGEQPMWFLGDNDLKWTTDASKAMRFARAQDAGLFYSQWIIPRAKELGRGREFKNVSFTDHAWC